MRTIRLLMALVFIMSWSVGVVASKHDQRTHNMAVGEGSTCCDSSLANIKGTFKVMNSEEVKALVDAKTAGALLIDARTAREFHKAHIRGAINIPVEKLEKNTALLTAPKDAKLVFYCNGVKCGKSKKAANIAIGQGYKDVSAYVDGMPVWTEKGYPLDVGVE